MLRKTATFLLLPISAIAAIASFRSVSKWYEKDQHGETDEQYAARKEVEGLCDGVAALSQTVRDGRVSTPEERAALIACTKHCEAAKTSYQKMIEAMRTRRQLQMGDQREHGILQIGKHHDQVIDVSDFYHTSFMIMPTASEAVKDDIEQELKKGFKNL